MKGGHADDDQLRRKFEAFERDSTEDFLRSLEQIGDDLRDGIEHLIHEREGLRDDAIAELEAASARLMKELAGVNQQRLLEELACFRDVLALQRQLLSNKYSAPNQDDGA